MRTRILVASILTLAVAAVAPAEVEKFAPASAVAAVRVRNVGKAIDSLGAVSGQQMPPIFLYMMLGRAVANTPLGPMAQGFDAKGEMMLVVLPPKDGDSRLVLVVPVIAYQQYVAGMTGAPGSKHVKEDSGLDVIEFILEEPDLEAMAAARERGDWAPKMKKKKVQRFMADAGKWAIVSADRGACQAVAAQNKPGQTSLLDLAAPIQRKGMTEKSLLVAVAVRNLLNAYANQIEELKKGVLPGIPGMPMPIPGMPGPAMGPPTVPGMPPGTGPGGPMAGIGDAVDQLTTAAKNVDLLAMGLDATEKGLSLTCWLTPSKTSTLAAVQVPAPTGTPGLARFLPASAAFGAAATIDAKTLQPLLELAVTMSSAQTGLPEDQQAQMKASVQKLVKAMGNSMAFAMRDPGPDSTALQVDQILTVKDAAAARAAILESLKLAPGTVAAGATQGVKATVKHEAGVRTYKGYVIDRTTATFDTSQADPQVMRSIEAMFKNGMVSEFTFSKTRMLMATGGEQPLNRVIDAISAGTGGLTDTENYRLAMSGLPAKRDGEFYMSLKKLLTWQVAIMEKSAAAAPAPQPMPGMPGAPGGPGPVMLLKSILPKLKGDLPVGGSLVAGERRLDIFVPAATLNALKAVGPGGPGMGPGPIPMPAMPPISQ